MPSVVAVLGPGGVGAFLAGALTRAGQSVTLVAREETAEVITREGISVQSVRLGDFHARPASAAAHLPHERSTRVGRLPDQPHDVTVDLEVDFAAGLDSQPASNFLRNGHLPLAGHPHGPRLPL